MTGPSASATDEPSAPEKKRARASVACSRCRAKRSKCDAIPGEKPCSQCKLKDVECEMPSEKRNRGHYKPQVEILLRRVQTLEAALAAASQNASPPLWPAQSQTGCTVPSETQSSRVGQVDPWSMLHHNHQPSTIAATTTTVASDPVFDIHQPFTNTGGTFSDSLSLAYSQGPTTTLDGIMAFHGSPNDPPASQTQNEEASGFAGNSSPQEEVSDRAPEKGESITTSLGEAQSIIGDPSCNLPSPTVNYLLGLFFHRFQIMLKFVSPSTLMSPNKDTEGGGDQPRRSLFLAALAAGLRYSTRPELTKAYIRADGENILATMARKALDSENHVHDVTTIQTLLILGEIETGAGRSMSGYSYSTMAAKLMVDLGIDPGSCIGTALSDPEIECRYWMLWLTSVQDQYWAISLHRPLAIKPKTLRMSRAAVKLALSATLGTAKPSFEKQVDEYLLDLMELGREITETLYNADPPPRPGPNALGTIDHLDSKLTHWLSSLPPTIAAWPVGAVDSYHFLYVIHLHADVLRIVLHRHRAFPAEMADLDGGILEDHSYTPLPSEEVMHKSRRTVAASATRIAKLFEIFRRREDLRSLQITGVQMATVAAEGLTAYLERASVDDAIERVAHLQSLHRTLRHFSISLPLARVALETSGRNIERFMERMESGDFMVGQQSDPAADFFMESEEMTGTTSSGSDNAVDVGSLENRRRRESGAHGTRILSAPGGRHSLPNFETPPSMPQPFTADVAKGGVPKGPKGSVSVSRPLWGSVDESTAPGSWSDILRWDLDLSPGVLPGRPRSGNS